MPNAQRTGVATTTSRIHLRADGFGRTPCKLDNSQRRNRRHLFNHRPLHPLQYRFVRSHPRSGGGPRAFGVWDYWRTGDCDLISLQPSRIEGIGRPRVEPSFLRDVVDDMITVPDAASIATIHWLEDVLGRKCGGSTGTNLWGTLQIAAEMHARGEAGSLVTLICDPGERYRTSYYNPEWIVGHDLDPTPWRAALDEFASGQLFLRKGGGKWPKRMAHLRACSRSRQADHRPDCGSGQRSDQQPVKDLSVHCQRCHMLHDRPQYLVQRWITYRRRLAVGDLSSVRIQH